MSRVGVMNSRYSFIQYINPEYRAPRGYGLIYFDYSKRFNVCAPIPFNFIMRVGDNIYMGLRYRWFPSYRQRFYGDAFHAGYERGLEDARHD